MNGGLLGGPKEGLGLLGPGNLIKEFFCKGKNKGGKERMRKRLFRREDFFVVLFFRLFRFNRTDQKMDENFSIKSYKRRSGPTGEGSLISRRKDIWPNDN